MFYWCCSDSEDVRLLFVIMKVCVWQENDPVILSHWCWDEQTKFLILKSKFNLVPGSVTTNYFSHFSLFQIIQSKTPITLGLNIKPRLKTSVILQNDVKSTRQNNGEEMEIIEFLYQSWFYKTLAQARERCGAGLIWDNLLPFTFPTLPSIVSSPQYLRSKVFISIFYVFSEKCFAKVQRLWLMAINIKLLCVIQDYTDPYLC